jgi:hypothetical protein
VRQEGADVDEDEMRDGTRETRETRLFDAAGKLRRLFFVEALSRPPLAVAYGLTQALAEAIVGKALLETNAMGQFDIEGYA